MKKNKLKILRSFKSIKNNSFEFLYSKKQSDAIYKLIFILLMTTIISHIFVWIIISYIPYEISWQESKFIKINSLFSLSQEWGYFEHFQYIILLWNGLLSYFIFRKFREGLYGLMILYNFLFINNMLSIHDICYEKFLIPFLTNFAFLSTKIIRIKDIAEIIYWLGVFAIFLFLSYFDYKKATVSIKKFLHQNYFLLVMLSFFSIFVDLINANLFKFYGLKILEKNQIILYIFEAIHKLVNIIEELGELGFIAIIFIILLRYSKKYRVI
jgi:hypothetical protein